jgi:hypothetical protein
MAPSSNANPDDGQPDTTFLSDLAEAVIGQHLDENGAFAPVSSARLVELRQRFSAGLIYSGPSSIPNRAEGKKKASTNNFVRWLGWFLADRSSRTISPNSPITIPEYIERLMEENTLPSAREAVLLSPTNCPALAHLAEMLVTSPGSNQPVTLSEARFLLRRAETLSPADVRVKETRQRVNSRLDSSTSR